MAITINSVASSGGGLNQNTFYSVVASASNGSPTTYQWQYTDNGTNWSNLLDLTNSVSGSTSYQLELYYSYVVLNPYRNYRVVVSAIGEDSVISSNFGFVAPVITINSFNSSENSNIKTYSVLATATQGATINYQWKYSDDSSVTWSDLLDGSWMTTGGAATISGSNTYQLQIILPVDFTSYRQYKCVLSANGALNVTSNIFGTPIPIITINSILSSVGSVGQNTSYSVSATATQSATILYQWQYSDNNGGAWSNLSDSADVSGTDTSNIQITYSYSQQYPNRLYRSVLSATGASTVISSNFGVPYPVITINSVSSLEGGPSESTFYSVAASATQSAVISYQWQYSDNNGYSWINLSNIASSVSGVSTNQIELSYSYFSQNTYRKYRLVLTANGAPTVTSGNFGSSPAPFITISLAGYSGGGNPGESVSYYVLASATDNAVINYQWQYSDNNGSNWNILSNSSPNLVGVSTSQLDISASYRAQNLYRKYRVELTATGASNVISTVFGDSPPVAPIITINSINSFIGANQTTFYSVSATATQGATITYQWQYSDNNQLSWSNLSNLVSGVSGVDTFQIQLLSSYVNQYKFRKYRVVLSANGAANVTSSSFGEEAPVITISATQSSGGGVDEDTIYAVIASATQNAGLNYQWQYSDTNGISWINLINSVSVLGATTEQLTLKYIITSQYPYRRYRVVLSATGASTVISTIFGNFAPVINISSVNSSLVGNLSMYSVAATATQGAAINYQWQYSLDGSTWVNSTNGNFLSPNGTSIISGSNTPELQITWVQSFIQSRKYRVVLSANGAETVTSSVFETYPYPTIKINSVGSSVGGNQNTFYYVSATISQAVPILYQWQYTDDNGFTWSDLSNDSEINGAQSSELSLSYLYNIEFPYRNYRVVLSAAGAISVNSTTFGNIAGVEIQFSGSFASSYSSYFLGPTTGPLIVFLHSGSTNNFDPSKSLGGPPSINQIVGIKNNLFIDVKKEDSEFGLIDYRCFYIFNESYSSTLFGASIYVDSEVSEYSTISLGISRSTEVQTIAFSGTPESGTFSLIYDKFTTNLIGWNPNPNILEQNIQSALNNIDGVSVSVAHTIGNNFNISFVEKSDNRSHPKLLLSSNFLQPIGTNIILDKLKEGQPINSIAPKIINKLSSPYKVVFYTTDKINRMYIGDIRPRDKVPIWIRRETLGNASCDVPAGFSLRLGGALVDLNQNISILENPCFYYV